MNEYNFTLHLRIFGGEIGHPQICEFLGLTAEWSHKAGEPRVDPKGRVLYGVYETDYCSISIPHPDSIGLADCIDKQIKFFLKYENLFLDIKRKNGRVEFFVGWFGDGNFGDIFKSSTLKVLGDLGVDLSFDIYAAP